MNILIVDDNECNLYQLQALLSGNGYGVVTAAHGVEALDRARQSPPDLVIADVLMPVMDGFSLCREWKKDERLKAIPFVFYTATYTDERDKEFALSLGAERFIVKPEEPDVFIRSIWEIIHQAEHGACALPETSNIQHPTSSIRPPAAAPGRQPVAVPEGKETNHLRQYNEVLVRKLEDKLIQLEQVRRELEQDIAQRKKAEEALVIKENAVASAISGVALADLNGNLTYVNRSFLRLWRYTEEREVLNHPMASFWQSSEEATQVLLTLRQSRAYVGEMIGRRKDGTCFQLELAASLVKDKLGQPICLMGSFLDISERKVAEAERRQLELQIQQAQKLESLGLLAGGIAHDFNNLLTAILAHAGLALADLPPNSPVRRNLLGIEKASHRAGELCRQLLAYSGRGRLIVGPLNLSRLVEELITLLKVSISKKVALDCKFANDLPTTEADAMQLRQVVMNLVINAAEAVGDNEGVVTISTGAQQCDEAYLRDLRTVETLVPGTYVYVEVTDTGCGMDAETQAKIFDPFFTTKFTGRGLGLAAVRGIARGHRGAIQVQSALGKGTTFRVLFPASTKPPSSSEPGPPSEEWRGSGTILVVDDEEDIRDVAAEMVQQLGFRVVTAADGREAVDLFQKCANEITCVLLDLTMPRMGGEEAARELRHLRPDVPIILTSGYSLHEITQRFADQPVAGFLTKPYQMADLRATLRQVLAGRGPVLASDGT